MFAQNVKTINQYLEIFGNSNISQDFENHTFVHFSLPGMEKLIRYLVNNITIYSCNKIYNGLSILISMAEIDILAKTTRSRPPTTSTYLSRSFVMLFIDSYTNRKRRTRAID